MALWTVYNFFSNISTYLYLVQTFELWSNTTDKVPNCNISNVIDSIWCHYLSLNDIRWHKMSVDDIWCLVIELSPNCCQDIPWGGQKETHRAKCLFVRLWVCLWVCPWVNLWFIELLDAAKNGSPKSVIQGVLENVLFALHRLLRLYDSKGFELFLEVVNGF